jgi:hypothetical protein
MRKLVVLVAVFVILLFLIIVVKPKRETTETEVATVTTIEETVETTDLETSEPETSETYNSEPGTSEPNNSQTYNSEPGTSESLTFLQKIHNWSIWSATSQGAPYIIAKPDYTLTYLVTARGNFTRYDVATVGIVMYYTYFRLLVERQLIVGMVDEMWPSTDSGEVPCRIDYFNGYNKVVKTITTVGTYNANANAIFISLDEVLAPMRGFDPQTLDIGTVDIIFYTNFGLAHVYVDVFYIFNVLTAMNDWFDKL